MLKFIIFVTILFVIFIFEVPFSVFVNLSSSDVLCEYMTKYPIKTQGYAYIKNGELYHGRRKTQKKGDVDTFDLLNYFLGKINLKSMHIRGMLGEEEIEDTLLESVLFSSVFGSFLSWLRTKNQFAHLSRGYQIEAEEDKNIFISAKFWLSVFDLFCIAFFVLRQKAISVLKRKGE